MEIYIVCFILSKSSIYTLFPYTLFDVLVGVLLSCHYYIKEIYWKGAIMWEKLVICLNAQDYSVCVCMCVNICTCVSAC